MRQDTKIALNPSLFASINGPALDALCSRVCSRRERARDSLARRCSIRICRQVLLEWRGEMRRRRLRRATHTRAGLMRGRQARIVMRVALLEWAAAAASPPRDALSSTRMHLPDAAPRAPRVRGAADAEAAKTRGSSGGGCANGLFRCFGFAGGASEGRGRAEGLDATHPGSEMRRLAAPDCKHAGGVTLSDARVGK